MNPKAKGERTEGIILAALLRKGFAVSIPFGNNQRYDLIVDDGTRLLKAQCKTACVVNGCVSFRAYSVNGFTGARTNYTGQADIFLVYCPQTDQVYRVPVADAGKAEVRLRVEPNRGGATSKIRWAADYLL